MNLLNTTDKQVCAADTQNPSQQNYTAYIQSNELPMSSSMISNPIQSDPNKNTYWRYVPSNYHPAYDPMNYPHEAQQLAADGSYQQAYQPELIAYDYSSSSNYNGYGMDQNQQQAFNSNSAAGVVDYSVMPCWPPHAILPHQQNPQMPLMENSNQFYQVIYEDHSVPKNRSNSVNSYNQFPSAYEVLNIK